MGLSTSILKDQELGEFRKLPSDANVGLELPVPSNERFLTDKKGYVLFGILMLVLVPFLIYTLIKSDIRRNYNGYDDCCNLCGIANSKIDGIPCSGKDYTDKPFETTIIYPEQRICSNECPIGYVPGSNNKTCLKEDGSYAEDDEIDVNDLWLHATTLWWKYLLITLIATTLCMMILLLFRFYPGVIVWGISGLSLLVAICITGLLWYVSRQVSETSKNGVTALAILATIFTIIIIIVFIVLFKKIQLVILLYKETTKALFEMPLTILLPLITLLVQILVLALFIVTTTVMITSGDRKQIINDRYEFRKNGAMQFTLIFNLIVTIWSFQFLSGCQYMVLAGSVAQWFFKKGQTSSPICISFTNTMRFHLGTIALGSFIITLVSVIKAAIRCVIANARFRFLFECCCGNIEAIVKFMSKNAYVETAIYGQSFVRSGKRAAKLLLTNATSLIAVNSVGDFVLAMTQFLLLAISTAIAYAIFKDDKYVVFLTIFSFFINLIVVLIVFNVFETIIDTLFVCYCEDISVNDGLSRPYYMSKELMQFVEKSKSNGK